jgi:outer membrane protein OmpA-like peptidoglycan-associated protein
MDVEQFNNSFVRRTQLGAGCPDKNRGSGLSLPTGQAGVASPSITLNPRASGLEFTPRLAGLLSLPDRQHVGFQNFVSSIASRISHFMSSIVSRLACLTGRQGDDTIPHHQLEKHRPRNGRRCMTIGFPTFRRLETLKATLKQVVILILLISCSFTQSIAQKQKPKKEKFKKGGIVQLRDSLTAYSQSDIFDFPNLHKARFYSDVGKLNHIKSLDKPETQGEMYQSLKMYVKNFGIENFSKSTPLLWKLAQLSEKHGPKGEAVLLYKLVVKHHQQGIDIKELYKRYQLVETEKKENYVPLDFYYKLVDYRKEIDTLRPPHSVLVNMGDGINSKKEDYGPTMGNVDYVLLFTSKRNPHDERNYNEDLFYALKVDGQWMQAEEFKTINTNYNEGSACLSQDGKFLYFSRCNAPNSLGNCDLYLAKLGKDSTWTDIKNLGPNLNSSGWDSHPSLSHSGDTLFFASNRVGGFGLSDIYYSLKDKKDNWGKAKNAGPIINTVNSEVSPFFHHRFNVLYYSSNGQPLNFGGFDIYKSYQRSGSWGEPKNIGPLVNGAGDEYYFTIDSQSHDLYYARSLEEDLPTGQAGLPTGQAGKKDLDLHSFPVPMEAQPLAATELKGSLKDRAGKPQKGIVSVIDLDSAVEVAPKFLREDGTFDFSLINKRNYLLIIQGDDYFRIEEIFFLDGDKEINRVAEPIETKIAFRSLEFENGKADILSTMHDDLAKLGNFMTDHPKLKLKISGHTDSAGDEKLNLKLSQDRADAIKKYLMQEFKVVDDRITSIGLGSAKPIISKEETEDHKQLNRRVEFEIVRE